MKRKPLDNMTFLFITVLIIFSSCQKDNKELTVEFETVEFGFNPTETKIISISSDTEWVVEIQQAGTWLSATPTSGRDDDILTLTAQVNDDFAERYATITVSGLGVKDKSIAVMQQGDKTKDVILLKKKKRIDNSWYEFEYDEQHRFTKRYDYSSDSTLMFTMTLTYDDDGELITAHWVTENDYSMHIQNPFIKEGSTISFPGFGIERYKIELNTDELPKKLTHTFQASHSHAWRKTTNTYTWVNRNLFQTDFKVIGETVGGGPYEESGTYIYTYDDKKSPFYHCATPRWFWAWYYLADITGCSLNNLVSVESGDEITNYEYTYNEDGFLATKKQGGVTITTYIYERIPGTGNSE